MDDKTDLNGDLDDVGRLIRHAGPRDEVPADRFERSREHVLGHWQQVLRAQRAGARRPRLMKSVMAAGVVAVLGIAIVLSGRWPAPGLTGAAGIERIVGELRVDGQAAGLDSAIPVGATLTTGPGDRAALRLAGGQALRIDAGSTVVLYAPDHLALDAGAVYVDSAGAAQDAAVRVATPFGTAQDIGTQFQVRLAGLTMIVGVRDGLVEVGHLGRVVRAVNAGFQVAFNAGAEQGSEQLDTEDPDWNWIESVTPAFHIDGASLAEYLDWYANEDGLELVWADDDSRARARRTTLTGGIEGMSPRESLDVVRKVAPFEYRREDGRLWVRVD